MLSRKVNNIANVVPFLSSSHPFDVISTLCDMSRATYVPANFLQVFAFDCEFLGAIGKNVAALDARV
jgi:hypothetical protein